MRTYRNVNSDKSTFLLHKIIVRLATFFLPHLPQAETVQKVDYVTGQKVFTKPKVYICVFGF